MIDILRFWRNKSKSEKEEIKSKYRITTMTYADIQKIYNENTKKIIPWKKIKNLRTHKPLLTDMEQTIMTEHKKE